MITSFGILAILTTKMAFSMIPIKPRFLCLALLSAVSLTIFILRLVIPLSNLPKGFKFENWRYSRFDSPTNPGKRDKVVRSARFDDDGLLVLDEVGSEDIYDFIQSFASSVDMDVIMSRYMHGDVDVMSRVQGIYGDFSEVSKNPAEILNKVIRGKEEFEKLPAEFKEKFGNDFARFVCTYDASIFASPDGNMFDSLGNVEFDTPEDVKSDES